MNDEREFGEKAKLDKITQLLREKNLIILILRTRGTQSSFPAKVNLCEAHVNLSCYQLSANFSLIENVSE